MLKFQTVTSVNQVATDVEAVRDLVEELYEEFPVIARRFEIIHYMAPSRTIV
jgi:hypothetical protein